MTKVIFVIASMLIVIGCSRPIKSNDAEFLSRLSNETKGAWTFSVSDIYLKAHYQSGTPSETEAESLAKKFWQINGESSRRESDITYINFYDNRNEFLFQFYWDPSLKRLIKSKRDYY